MLEQIAKMRRPDGSLPKPPAETEADARQRCSRISSHKIRRISSHTIRRISSRKIRRVSSHIIPNFLLPGPQYALPS